MTARGYPATTVGARDVVTSLRRVARLSLFDVWQVAALSSVANTIIYILKLLIILNRKKNTGNIHILPTININVIENKITFKYFKYYCSGTTLITLSHSG